MPLQRDREREREIAVHFTVEEKEASICRLQLAQGRGEVGSTARVKSQVI